MRELSDQQFVTLVRALVAETELSVPEIDDFLCDLSSKYAARPLDDRLKIIVDETAKLVFVEGKTFVFLNDADSQKLKERILDAIRRESIKKK